MKISYAWLEDYFEKPLLEPEKVGELLTMHAFEIESIDVIDDDTLLDVKVLPDRSHDCLSHIGIAREVAVLSGVALKPDVVRPKELSVPESNVLKGEIEDTKLCKRFSSLVIENIEVKESPSWMKERLATIGQRSINNVVDATNYVMFALGQPLHAYDRDLLTENGGGWKIVVRKAKAGESLMALDSKEYSLTDELVIVDGNADKVLGIAGIKGGKASEITKKTKHIVLEAANFEPVNIRKTSKKLGLRTDASVRFENEITPELTIKALKMVADLIMNIAGTDETQVEGLVDIYPRKANPYKVGVSLSEIQSTLGMDITQKKVEDIFDRSHFDWKLVDPRKVIAEMAETLIGVPYKFGASVLYDGPKAFDCSSFVAYLYKEAGIGLPRIAIDQYVYGTAIEEADVRPGDLVFSNTGRSIHTEGSYYSQVLGKDVPQIAQRIETLEFMPGTAVPECIDHVGVCLEGEFVLHATSPVGVIKEQLKASSMFERIVGYRRIQAADTERFVVTIPSERLDLRLKEDLIEEIGRIYGYENLVAKPLAKWEGNVEIEKQNYYSNILRNLFVDNGFSEVITYAFRTKGEVELANPVAKDRAFLRANLADGLNEALKLNTYNADLLGLSQVKIFEIGNVFKTSGEHLMLACAAKQADEIQKLICSTLGVGQLSWEKNGDVHEAHIGKIIHDLPEPNEMKASLEMSSARFKVFSEYPFVLRDIAVFVPEGQSEQIIIETIEKESGTLLVSHRLFDTFTKEFPEGKKTSYAYRLAFQSMEKTLSDEEIHPIMERVTATLNGKEGFQVR